MLDQADTNHASPDLINRQLFSHSQSYKNLDSSTHHGHSDYWSHTLETCTRAVWGISYYTGHFEPCKGRFSPPVIGDPRELGGNVLFVNTNDVRSLEIHLPRDNEAAVCIFSRVMIPRDTTVHVQENPHTTGAVPRKEARQKWFE